MENRLFKLVTCGVLVVTQAGCSKTPEAAKHLMIYLLKLLRKQPQLLHSNLNSVWMNRKY
jgi:hypothetical protein